MKVKSHHEATLPCKMLTESVEVEDHFNPKVRVIEVSKNEGANCGFHLTRGKWDPYPWVSSVDEGSRAAEGGVKPGDCVLEVNGEDVIGQRVSEIADLVRSKPEQVSLLLWNAGVDIQCSPEALCCGPMPINLQRLSACTTTILSFLECPVCLDTCQAPTYQCENGHLICIKCRSKSERCPVCRIRFARGRSLLADQVYQAVIDAFDLKDVSLDKRSAKVQEIFKVKSRKNVPDIKVTQSPMNNKFFNKLIGISNSVDNLSKSPAPFKDTNCFDAINLKSKSQSTNEIFQNSENSTPFVSRTNSVSRLGRSEKNRYLGISSDKKSSSCHCSFESLQDKIIEETATENSPRQLETNILLHCPFKSTCDSLIDGSNVLQHFTKSHTGPLIQYFAPKIQISIEQLLKEEETCFVIFYEENMFFFKSRLIHDDDVTKTAFGILIWVWATNENLGKKYNAKLVITNQSNVLLSVFSQVFPLTVSNHDIKSAKKGLFLNKETIEKINLETSILEIELKS